MTIAYDLRYADTHFTGIGTYAYALLRALLDGPGDETYAVLWNPRERTRYDIEPIRSHPRVRWCEERISPLGFTGLFALGSWLRRVKPAVYFSPYLLLPVRAGCPCVLTVHDVWPLRLPGLSAAKLALYRASLMRARSARFVLTVSDFSRQEIVRFAGIPEDRVRAVRSGVPPLPPPGEGRRPSGVPDQAFALVVGDNRPRKNLGVLAEAWAEMGEDPPFALVWAGPADPRYPALDALAARLGARRVHALGWCDEVELAWLYENAMIALFPTLYEGFGYPLVEAFARGLPVVGADIPTLREIGDGVARFVDPHDAAAWRHAVVSLAEALDERARMSEAGLARAAELTYAHTARETRAVLLEAAGDIHPRG